MISQYLILVVRGVGVALALLPWFTILAIMGFGGSGFTFDGIDKGTLTRLLAWSATGAAIFLLSVYLERLRKRQDPFDSPPDAPLR